MITLPRRLRWATAATATAAGLATMTGMVAPAQAASTTLASSGCQVVTIPDGVTQTTVTATGAAGQIGRASTVTTQPRARNGHGDRVTARLTVQPGQVFTICADVFGGLGGPGGAGAGAGGKGGGLSGIWLGRSLSQPLVIAAGGGGGGGNSRYGLGGAGGAAGTPGSAGIGTGPAGAGTGGGGGGGGAGWLNGAGGGGTGTGGGGGGGGGGTDMCRSLPGVTVQSCTADRGAGTRSFAGTGRGMAQVTVTY